MKIIEQIAPSARGDGQVRAANILVHLGAQFVEEAITCNPDGPVRMHTEISRADVTYDVTLGYWTNGVGDPYARCIWHQVVVFGHTDRTVAGGAAFVEAARAQEAVAWAALDLLEARR